MSFFDSFREIFFQDSLKNRGVVFHPPFDCTSSYADQISPLFLDEIIVATDYPSIRGVIHDYKYHSFFEEKDQLVDFILQIPEISSFQNSDRAVITSVPMGWLKYAIRGYDHMYHIAYRVSKSLGIPYQKILTTKRQTFQVFSSKKKRLENKRNAFILNASSELPETVILIDDIISTGSTANEVAKVLKKAGVKRVFGWFIASNIFHYVGHHSHPMSDNAQS